MSWADEPVGTPAPPSEGASERIVAWVEDRLGGTVERISRQPRWRPVWFVDLVRDGERLELLVRGERTDMPLMFPLQHEMVLQDLLHERDIPTPKVHGWIDDPAAYVMDRVGGQPDFTGTSDADRAAVVDDYLQILARMHALDIGPFVEAGILRAPDPSQSGLFGLSRYERVYRAIKSHPDPLMEFCLGWIRRNPPDSKGRESAIVWDSGQFHQVSGRITAVLDVEIGHIGDPMMDLAAWRMRDTIIGYGDFDQLYARYGELAGAPVDVEALKRHHFVFTLTNQLGLGQLMRTPPPGSDLMTNMQWCYETNLFATEALAEILDLPLPTVEVPDERWTRATPGLGQLVDRLRNLPVEDEYLRYEIRTLFRAARSVARINGIGDAFDAADVDDLHQLLGRRPETWLDGEAELERFVLAHADSSAYDEQLLHVFHRRNLRAHALLGPPGSAMTKHLPIQTFRQA